MLRKCRTPKQERGGRAFLCSTAVNALTLVKWKRTGTELARLHDATVWQIGDWYLAGRQKFGPGECRRVVKSSDWKGVKFDTARCTPASQSAMRQSLGT